MCVKLSILQERDYGDPALLQVRPYYPFRVHRHLYQFVPKSLSFFWTNFELFHQEIQHYVKEGKPHKEVHRSRF